MWIIAPFHELGEMGRYRPALRSLLLVRAMDNTDPAAVSEFLAGSSVPKTFETAFR
jgi:hypothetical protein